MRKNAFEVKQNGDVYVNSIGRYDGTNSQTAQSIQTVLSNIQSKTDDICEVLEYTMSEEGVPSISPSANKLIETDEQRAHNAPIYQKLINRELKHVHIGIYFPDDDSSNYEVIGHMYMVDNSDIPYGMVMSSELSELSYALSCTVVFNADGLYEEPLGGVGAYMDQFQLATYSDLDNYAAKSEVTAVDTKITDIPVEKGTGANSVVQKGGGNIASNVYAFAEGVQTKATGFSSHAEGYYTTASGERSHAEGNTTQTLNQGEHAEGNYNISIKDKTIHTVGIGTADDKKNAHEIHLDGSHYIVGIGGYNGNNSQTAGVKTLQTVIADKLDKMININWEALKDKRDAGELIPGQKYRITDYVTIITQINTLSAGDPFDIIVTALDTNKLSEVAAAIQHTNKDSDPFKKCKLNAWKLWYCLDNDSTRFAWATTNGKGVIYRLIDEFNNDVPYDFKNIKFKHPTDTTTYPYYYYTFSAENAESNFDYSRIPSNNIYLNQIKPYINNGIQHLNKIVFFGSNCYNNTFGNNCYNNIFNRDCYGNTFGDGCYGNTFGDYARYNTFDVGCTLNKFGINCSYNTFGVGCSNNIFATDSDGSTPANYFLFNTLESGVQYCIIHDANTASINQFVKNYHIKSSVAGTSSNKKGITVERNRSFDTTVALNSYGVLKYYCEADLIA